MHMTLGIPMPRYQQIDVAAFDIDHAVDNSFCAITADGHSDLFSDMTVDFVQWRSLGDNCFVEHQQNGTKAVIYPAF